VIVGAALGDLAADLSLAAPVDPFEFNPVAWVILAPREARAFCWFDVCAACGACGLDDGGGDDGGGGGGDLGSTSSGSVGSARGEDGRLLHCADCGEGFHPFCLPQSLPLATMDPITRLGWRCAMPRCLSLARACRCRPRSSALCIPVLPLRSLSCLSCLAVHVFVCVFVLFSPTTLFFLFTSSGA
jgi:hypothetical protein